MDCVSTTNWKTEQGNNKKIKQRVNMKLSQYNNAMNELQRTGSLSRITDYFHSLVFKKREMRSASVLINKLAQYI